MPQIIETFNWPVRLTSTGEGEQVVRTAKFGDGYAQRSAEGINSAKEIWEIRVTGNAAKIAAVKAFIKAHQGARAFHWTPPLGEPGLYVTTGGWRLSGHGAQKYTLSTTFEQTFHP